MSVFIGLLIAIVVRDGKNSGQAFEVESLEASISEVMLMVQASIYGIAAGYYLSASLLSIINKWAIMKFHYPGALTTLQYFTTATRVLLCGQVRVLAHDPLDLCIMWRFLRTAIIFYLSLFRNSELFLHANVDTFIIFRSTVPIFVAIGEALYLYQPWPSFRCSPFDTPKESGLHGSVLIF